MPPLGWESRTGGAVRPPSSRHFPQVALLPARWGATGTATGRGDGAARRGAARQGGATGLLKYEQTQFKQTQFKQLHSFEI